LLGNQSPPLRKRFSHFPFHPIAVPQFAAPGKMRFA
jgi:hypothetical protein